MKNISARCNKKIRSILLARGQTLADWANEHGFKPKTVYQNLWRCGQEGDKKPHTAVIKALEKDTGVRICGAQAEAKTAKQEGTEWQARM